MGRGRDRRLFLPLHDLHQPLSVGALSLGFALSPLKLLVHGLAKEGRPRLFVLKAGVHALQGAGWEPDDRGVFVYLFSAHGGKYR